jgi:hypothetical protein
MLILKALLHKIFSAFHRTSEESEEQSINFRDDRQRIKRVESERESSERIEGKASGKVSQKTYSITLKNITNNRTRSPSTRRTHHKHYHPFFLVPIIQAILKTCQANNFLVRFGAIPGQLSE